MSTLLILHASCGAGHRRAAEAIATRAAHRPGGPLRVVVRDVLDFAPSPYRHSYSRGYAALVRKAPRLWGGLYAATDGDGLRAGGRALLRLCDRAAVGRGLRRAVRDLAPDAVVATHFLPLAILAGRERDAEGGPPLTGVVTDYHAHSLWAAPGVCAYAVPSEEAASDLAERGIPRDRLTVTGIPVDPGFAPVGARRPAPPDGGLRRILILSGGAGVGGLGNLLTALDAAFGDLEITVSAGDNRPLAAALTHLAARLRSRVRVVGIVSGIERLIGDADLLLTKPGGLTVTEAAVARVPLVLFPGIPGQEEANARIFERAGAARLGATPDRVVGEVRRLREDPIARRRMHEAQARLGRPEAADRILALALGTTRLDPVSLVRTAAGSAAADPARAAEAGAP
ncbi:MAG: MGDG synthase family glycosyltransferase [Candidatus Polarisedimenticolia bacterium]